MLQILDLTEESAIVVYTYADGYQVSRGHLERDRKEKVWHFVNPRGKVVGTGDDPRNAVWDAAPSAAVQVVEWQEEEWED